MQKVKARKNGVLAWQAGGCVVGWGRDEIFRKIAGKDKGNAVGFVCGVGPAPAER